MNLINQYCMQPDNYIVEAGGGYGKSTSLKHLAKSLMGQKIEGKTVLTIYIPLAELNVQKIEKGVLFEYLKRYFFEGVTQTSILEMIKESNSDIQYVFLLDGLNEVHNYEINGQTTLGYIYNDILELVKQENVHVLISTRLEEIPNHIRNKFKMLVLQTLSNDAMRAYLGQKIFDEIPDHLRELLRNPMLLTIFKVIYDVFPMQAIQINNKYTLFELYYKKEIELHIAEDYMDYLQTTVRPYLYETIIPYMAFFVEYSLLSGIREESYEQLLFKAYHECDNPNNISFGLVSEAIIGLGVLDKDLVFRHELVRDFYAAKGFSVVGRMNMKSRDITEFLQLLVQHLKYEDNRRDLARRTRFLDLGDFLFASVGTQMNSRLIEFGFGNEKERICLAEDFYQQLAGVYDDLSSGYESALIGKIAFAYMGKAERFYSKTKAARRYNYLYYTIKWGDRKDCLSVVEYAKQLLDEEDETKKDGGYHKLYGKVLSNIGSYYYKLGSEEVDAEKEREMFLKAEEWHLLSLEYRKKHYSNSSCDAKDLAASYRTLMSDAYQLGDYYKGYRYYKDALGALGQGLTLREMVLFDSDSVIPEDLVERAMGSEIGILTMEKDTKLALEILEKMPEQIEYVYEQSVSISRINRKMLKSLQGKLETILRWAEKENHTNLKEVAEEYLKKCSSF